MPENRPILAATDLSEHGALALARARALAEAEGREVIAAHVIREEPLWWVIKARDLDPDELRRRLLTRAEQDLQAQVDALPASKVPCRTLVSSGQAFMEIIRQARANRCDLIVVGAHGQHKVQDWFIGTTAERVVSKSDRPVLVTRQKAEGPYREVVLGVDFSSLGQTAIRMACQLAAADARFTLVHIYELWFEPRLAESDLTHAVHDRIVAQEEQRLLDELKAFARSVGLAERHVHFEIRQGYPGPGLLHIARERNADLIACGTHGMSGVQYVLLGSVAQHVLRQAHCDVLIARHGKPS